MRKEDSMKVKDMIKMLSLFNPEAEFNIVVGSESRPFEICFGSNEGCTKSNCDSVDLFVNSNAER